MNNVSSNASIKVIVGEAVEDGVFNFGTAGTVAFRADGCLTNALKG